jgi:hypothetical protein
MIYRLALLALLLSACAPLPTCETCGREAKQLEIVVCLDHAFTDDDTEAAHRAADAWTDALCGLVVVRPVTVRADAAIPEYCDRMVYRAFSTFDWVTIQGSSMGGGCIGDDSWIIVDRIDPTLMEKAFTHEIGHLLGTSHGEGVMRPVLSGGCIDRRAAVQAALDTAARKASQCRVIGGKP